MDISTPCEFQMKGFFYYLYFYVYEMFRGLKNLDMAFVAMPFLCKAS